MRELFDRIDQYQAAINQRRPFEGEMLNQLKAFYRVGLTWSSNAIEGNSLTISETKILLEEGLTVGGRPLRDTFETLGHAAAYDYMFSLLGARAIREEDILTLHKLFYNQIDASYAGRYRDIDVAISGSAYPLTKPPKIAGAMAQFVQWLADSRGKYHPAEYAALAHKRFVFIHPFIDGNGRVSRLLMNAALIQAGYLPVLIAPVIRGDYMRCLETAHRDDRPFVEFIAKREEQSQRELMRLFHIPFPNADESAQGGEHEAGESTGDKAGYDEADDFDDFNEADGYDDEGEWER